MISGRTEGIMYINEVIRQADALDPNEYTLNEKYAWIDELNALLMQEHMRKYASADLEPMKDGAYLLPGGITFEMVDKIIAHGREIEKYDLRSFGIDPVYTPRERFYMPVHCRAGGAITVIYLAQAQPIRTARVENLTIHTQETMSGGNYFDYADIENCPFQEGDALKLSRAASDADWLNSEVTVAEVDVTLRRVYFWPAAFSVSGQKTACIAERIVTEQTLVPPPYDRMYIDWIIAKIGFYQNNYVVYNQNMNKFYNTLRQFDNWYISRAPMNKDNKIRNWFK